MTQFEIVGEDLGFPEGPVVCDDGSLIVVEVRRERVTRIRPDGTKHKICDIDGAPNGLAFGPDGALYCCNNGGFAWEDGVDFPTGTKQGYRTGSIDRINISTGKVERVYESCDGQQLAGPNDLMFDRHGGIWFTDLGKDLVDRELHGGLYYAQPDGSSIKRIVGGVAFNGVGVSPDGTTVYAAASFLRHLLAFEAGPDPQPQGHGVGAGRLVFDYPRRRYLDSLAMEADGTIAQAVVLDEPGISRVNPETGSETTIPFPDVLTTNIAFGGADMRTAYVTLTTTNLLVKCTWPAPGLRLPFNG